MNTEGDLLPTAQTEDDTQTPDAEKASKGSKSPSLAEVSTELAVADYVEVIDKSDRADAKKAFWWCSVYTIIIAVLIPIPLGASNYVYSEGFFTAWIVVAMVRQSLVC